MDEERIDLSALDPGRDPERMERMVRAVLTRAAQPPAHPLASAVVARGRTAVIAAVAVAVLAWVPALAGRSTATGERRAAAPVAAGAGTPDASGTDATSRVAAWAMAGAIPVGTDVYGVLGADDDR